MTPHDPDDAVPLPTDTVGPAVARLRAAVPDLWGSLGALCLPLDSDAAAPLVARLRGSLGDTPREVRASGELANELLALYAGWDHYGSDERAVLVGAMSYLLADDGSPAAGHARSLFGVADDERVVRACIRVLLRRMAA